MGLRDGSPEMAFRDGCPRWLPEMAAQNGLPQKTVRDGCHRWLPEIAISGSPSMFGKEQTLVVSVMLAVPVVVIVLVVVLL